jgi:hypothetical protein
MKSRILMREIMSWPLAGLGFRDKARISRNEVDYILSIFLATYNSKKFFN